MPKEPVKQRPRNPNVDRRIINPGPLSVVGSRKNLTDRASRGPFPPAEDSEGPGQLAEGPVDPFSPAGVAAGVPEEPGDVAGTSPEVAEEPAEAVSGTSGYPEIIVFAPPAGMVEGLEAGLKRVLDEQRGGSETVTKRLNTETTQFLKLTFPSWNDRVKNDPTYKFPDESLQKFPGESLQKFPEESLQKFTKESLQKFPEESLQKFTEEYLKKFFANLPKYVDALNVRFMAELIASVGDAGAEGVAGGKTAFEVPDIFVSIECHRLGEKSKPPGEKSEPPGEESEPPGEQSEPPGKESRTHVVTVLLHSGTKLVYTHGPEPNQWALEIPKGTGIPDGSQTGGAGMSSLTGFFRKGVAYLGLLVESCLHTANHMARRRAHETFFDLLPKEFHTEEYARHWPPCIGIIEARIIQVVMTTNTFIWGDASVPYRSHDFLNTDLDRAKAAFDEFDIYTFLTERPSPTSYDGVQSVLPLYKTLMECRRIVWGLPSDSRDSNRFAYSKITIPGGRRIRLFQNEHTNENQILIDEFDTNGEIWNRYVLEKSDPITNFLEVSEDLYTLTNGEGFFDNYGEQDLFSEFTRLKQAMVEHLVSGNKLIPNDDNHLNLKPWFEEVYLQYLDMKGEISKRQHYYPLQIAYKFLRTTDLKAAKFANFERLSQNHQFDARFPKTHIGADASGPSMMAVMIVLTPEIIASMYVFENFFAEISFDGSHLEDIISTCLSVDVFPVRNPDVAYDVVNEPYNYINDLRRCVHSFAAPNGVDAVLKYNEIVFDALSSRLNTLGNTDDYKTKMAAIRASYIAIMLGYNTSNYFLISGEELDQVKKIYFLLKGRVGTDILKEETNFREELLDIPDLRSIIKGKFISYFVRIDSNGIPETTKLLPSNWVLRIGVKEDYSERTMVNGMIDGLTASIDEVIDKHDPTVREMATEMYRHYEGVRDMGESLEKESGMIPVVESRVDSLESSGGKDDMCGIGSGDCLHGYSFPTSPSGNETILNKLHYYFSVAEQNDYEEGVFDDQGKQTGTRDIKSAFPLTICAAHILIAMKSDRNPYYKSLFDEVVTSIVGKDDKGTKTIQTVQVPAYVTIKGSASYVRKQITEYNKNKADVVEVTTTTSPLESGPENGSGEISAVAPVIIPHVTGVNHPNYIPDRNATGGGGSPGPSGLSALTFAFLGAVTFAAAFCRRP